MRIRKKQQGFTLVEIMIVVAIIALLAAIAIPNLLRARMSSNDALAKATLRAISTAAESYGTANNGAYPAPTPATSDILLTGATPPYLNQAYCGQTLSGYGYTCNFTALGYTVTATPVQPQVTGTTTEVITTGGVLTP